MLDRSCKSEREGAQMSFSSFPSLANFLKECPLHPPKYRNMSIAMFAGPLVILLDAV